MQHVITISSNVQSGTPVFTGTRVPIKNFFDYLKGGDTVKEFLHDFPSVSEQQVNTLLQMVENIATSQPTDAREKSTAG